MIGEELNYGFDEMGNITSKVSNLGSESPVAYGDLCL